MGKGGILILLGALVAVLYFAQSSNAGQAAQSQQPTPGPTPGPSTQSTDPVQQAIDLANQVQAGAEAVTTILSGGAVASVTGAVTTAVSTTTAAVTQAATAVGTAVNTAVGQAQIYLPYLGPAVAVAMIVQGLTQTHRIYDPVSHQCCDASFLAKVNCRYDWGIMKCIYEVYDYPQWPREHKINMIFAELQSWRGVVQAGKALKTVRSGGSGGYTTLTFYTPSGLPSKPIKATDVAPGEFRILNAEEIAKYQAIKQDVIAFNKSRTGIQTIERRDPGYTSYSPNYGYLVQGRTPAGVPVGGRWTPIKPPDIITKVGQAWVTEFNINWLY